MIVDANPGLIVTGLLFGFGFAIGQWLWGLLVYAVNVIAAAIRRRDPPPQ